MTIRKVELPDAKPHPSSEAGRVAKDSVLEFAAADYDCAVVDDWPETDPKKAGNLAVRVNWYVNRLGYKGAMKAVSRKGRVYLVRLDAANR